MKHLSLDSLRAFVTVVDLQSYTRAGERLGRSQPAISLQIKKLEQQLSSPLIQRQDNRIKLSPSGQELYQAAQQMLLINDKLIAQLSEPDVAGDVRLGIPSEFATSLLPRIIGQFASTYPQVTLQVTSGLSRELRLGASRGQFDIILTVAESAPADALLVKQDMLVWVAGRADFPVESTIPLVLAPEGCVYRRRAISALKAEDKAFRLTYTNSDLAGISSALHSRLGITVLARSTVPEQLAELRHESLPVLGEVGIFIEQHSSRRNLAAEHLTRYMQEALQHHPL